jgi:hypothetical protein
MKIIDIYNLDIIDQYNYRHIDENRLSYIGVDPDKSI